MVSPRAVADVHSASIQGKTSPSLLEPPATTLAEKKLAEEEIQRLRQENMQLRQDLEDAYSRIRELEYNQVNASLFQPSSSYASSGDDASVEISVTSSTTTVQMGNSSNNATSYENIPPRQQQSRDDDETKPTEGEIIKSRGANYHRASRASRRHRNPFSHALPRKIPELRRLFSSESETSSVGSNTESISSMRTCASDATVGVDSLAMPTRHHDNRHVSSYAMNYFQRADSGDESDGGIPSKDRRFEV